MSKTGTGNFFEDFRGWPGDPSCHTANGNQGDTALYQALTGSRFLQHCSDPFARSNGLPGAPAEDLLAFHLVFGKTVPDVSLNAVANLGYADGRFLGLVYPGDTLHARSEVIGLKETSSGQTGIVWVRSRGFKADGTPVLDYVRWVMVRKRDHATPAPVAVVPRPAGIRGSRPADRARRPPPARIDPVETGSPYFFEDYVVGERMDHVDGMGVMESEHRLATRLYHNAARVHFNDHTERQGRLAACIVYGGVVISLARALRSMAWAIACTYWRSTLAATSIPAGPATPSMPGPKCWPRPTSPVATMWARFDCGWSPPAIGHATIFR